MVDETVVDRQISMLNSELEVVVRLVQFIPEEQIGLKHIGDEVVQLMTRSEHENRPERVGTPLA